MKIQRSNIWGQCYILPTVRITHDRFLNGYYEVSLIWGKWEIDLIF